METSDSKGSSATDNNLGRSPPALQGIQKGGTGQGKRKWETAVTEGTRSSRLRDTGSPSTEQVQPSLPFVTRDSCVVRKETVIIESGGLPETHALEMCMQYMLQFQGVLTRNGALIRPMDEGLRDLLQIHLCLCRGNKVLMDSGTWLISSYGIFGSSLSKESQHKSSEDSCVFIVGNKVPVPNCCCYMVLMDAGALAAAVDRQDQQVQS
jgi:hypothetical protein